ncbi:MAG: PH domain-containing protein, partial [Bradymonadaceae bacterium]
LLIAAIAIVFMAFWVADKGGGFFFLILIPLYMILTGLFVGAWYYSYSKISYTIGPDRLVFRGGGLAWSREVEIEIEKITQVKLRQSLWEKMVFGTGTVSIDAAGSTGYGVSFSHIAAPDALCEELQERMRARGFSLQRRRLVVKERPSLIACVASVLPGLFWTFIAGLVVLALTSAILGQSIGAENPRHFLDLMSGEVEQVLDGSSEEEIMEVAEARRTGVIGAAILGLLYSIIAFFSFLSVIKMRRRFYSLYDDVIDYEQRFWTRVRRIIPIENVTNVTFNQGLLKRLLGIADVTISTQGATGTLGFKWMPRGPNFVSLLQRCMDGEEVGEVDGADEDPAQSEDRLELRMSMGRALTTHVLVRLLRNVIPVIVFGAAAVGFYYLGMQHIEEPEALEQVRYWGAIVLAVFLLLPILFQIVRLPATFARIRATRYVIDPKSIRSTYTLLSREETRFATEKITAVTVRQDLCDLIFRTATINFRSIGSDEALRFMHIPLAQLDLPRIAGYIGLAQSEATPTVVARFSPARWFVARGRLFIFYLFAALAALPFALIHPVALVLPALILVAGPLGDFFKQWADSSRGELTLHDDHVVLRRGWLRTFAFMASYENLKHIRSMTCPVGDWGELRLHAGTGAAGILRYIDEPWKIHDQLDQLMHKKGCDEPLDMTARSTHRPALANSLVGLLAASFFFCPFLALLPFTLAWTVLAQRRTSYVIEAQRVVVFSGILWRWKQTV